MWTVPGVSAEKIKMRASWVRYNGNDGIPAGSMYVVKGINIVLYTAIIS